MEMFSGLIKDFEPDDFDKDLVNVIIGLLALCNDSQLSPYEKERA